MVMCPCSRTQHVTDTWPCLCVFTFNCFGVNTHITKQLHSFEFSSQNLSHPSKCYWSKCSHSSKYWQSMDVQPDIDLVSIFNEVFLVQTYLHKLEIIEEIITDISDFVEDQALPQPSVQLNAMRQQVGQVKIQLRFLLQLKLLEACRRLRQHVLQYGHLPLLNLDFRRWLALILRHHLPTPASARLDATIFPWWQKDHGGSCHRWIKACRLRSFLQHVGISQEHAQQIRVFSWNMIKRYL